MIRDAYFVEWIDSGISLLGNVWQTFDEVNSIAENAELTETVGFLIYESQDWIILAQTINDNQVRGGYCIYKKNIKTMRRLTGVYDEGVYNKKGIKDEKEKDND